MFYLQHQMEATLSLFTDPLMLLYQKGKKNKNKTKTSVGEMRQPSPASMRAVVLKSHLDQESYSFCI